MLKQILALTWKDLKIFCKDPRGIVLIFIQPFIFILVMSYALSGLYRSGDRPIQLLAVNHGQGTSGTAILRQLGEMKAFQVETQWDGQPLTRQKAEQLIKNGNRTYALVFPSDFTQVLEQGPGVQELRTTKVFLIVDPAASSQFVEPIMGTLQGLVERSHAAAIMQVGQGDPGTFQGRKERSVIVERIAPVGMQAKKKPDAFQQNVPGFTIYGIFWIVNLLGLSVLREKREGTFRRLLLAPMSRVALLAGKLLPYYLINIAQIAIMLGVSSLLFKMSLGDSPVALVVVSLAVAATATGLGILVAALARTEAQIGSFTVLILLTLSAVGGCFIPRFIMPEWLRTIGLVTPHAWALDAYQDLLVRGYGLFEILPKIGVLAAFAVVFFAIGVWRFRFE
jgi:ABC-2 type transport system permease protein